MNKKQNFWQRNKLYKGEEQNGNFRNKIHNIANFKIALNWFKSTMENMGKTWGELEDRTTEAMQLKQLKRLEKLNRESGTCEMISEDLEFLCQTYKERREKYVWFKIYLLSNSASLRPHQRHFFLQKMAINTETLSQSMCRKQTSECSTLNRITLSQLSPQGYMLKDYKIQRWQTTSRKYGFPRPA